MRQFAKASMTVAVIMGIFISGWAFAAGPPPMGQRGQTNPPPPKDDGIHLLMKYEMENIAVNVIAGLTGQAVENIQADLEDSDMQTLLETYSVDEALFRNAMKMKMLELVNEAVASGRITQVQADAIIARISTQPDAARP
jgi:hypothetical protein